MNSVSAVSYADDNLGVSLIATISASYAFVQFYKIPKHVLNFLGMFHSINDLLILLI